MSRGTEGRGRRGNKGASVQPTDKILQVLTNTHCVILTVLVENITPCIPCKLSLVSLIYGDFYCVVMRISPYISYVLPYTTALPLLLYTLLYTLYLTLHHCTPSTPLHLTVHTVPYSTPCLLSSSRRGLSSQCSSKNS